MQESILKPTSTADSTSTQNVSLVADTDNSLYTMDELESFVDELEYLIYPFLQKKGVLIVGAEPKSFKTYFVMQMMTALGTAQDFFGWSTRRNAYTPAPKILYIDQEIGAAAFRKRYLPMKASFGAPNMLLRAKSKKEILLDPNEHGRNHLEVLIKAHRPDVVVFDSLRKTTKKDESSSTDIADVFRSLTQLQETYDFAAVIVHHAAKPSDGRKPGSPTSLRGSGEIFAHADSVAMLTQTGSNSSHIDVSWTFRNHEGIDDFRLRFDSQTGLLLKRDATSKKVTSIAASLKNISLGDEEAWVQA